MTESISLTYAFTHLGDLGLRAMAPTRLWLLLLLVPLLGIGMRRARGVARWLRALVLVLVIAALAEIRLTVRLPDDRLSLVVLADQSESIDASGREWQQRYIEEVRRALAPRDRLEVVAFGAAAKRLGPEALPKQPISEIQAGATDIGNALDQGFGLASAAELSRIVLLSDGHQTRGDAIARLPQARHEQIAIFTAVPPHQGGMDAGIEKLTLPEVATLRTMFPMQVTVSNHGRAHPVELALSVDGRRIGSESLTLQPGLNAIEIPYRLDEAGTHRVEAELLAVDDRIEANNRLSGDITVVGQLRVLLIGRQTQSAIRLSLARQGVAVTQISPTEAVVTASELAKFTAVVLEDVAAGDLRGDSWRAIETFVRDAGGAMVFVGGQGSYGDPAFKGTAIERLLPVTLEPYRPRRPQRPPLGLFMVIDRSNSMGYHFRRSLERSDSESKLVYARRAALAVLGQLKSNDLIGVIAFDAMPHELSPLRRVAESRADLQETIPRLQPDGGTDFYDALDSAATQLAMAPVSNRHVILLTDGDTNRSEGHDQLIDRLERAAVTVTTIRIGDDRANLKLLTKIAERTGGEFYHIENAESLPELMLRDTGNALARVAQRDEIYNPRIRSGGQLLSGFEQSELPTLYGYAFARAKPGADVLLEVSTQERRDPLLAAWQYGLGRVVAFTASPYDDAEAWMGWNKLGKFWSQAVRWAAREHALRDYAVHADRIGGVTWLEVRSFASDEGPALWARVEAEGEGLIDVPLEQVAPRRYRGWVPNLAAGVHRVSIVERLGERDVSEQTHRVQFPDRDRPPREERFADQPNLSLLRRLAEQSGGQFNPPIRTLIDRPAGQRIAEQPLDWLLAPLAALLFLVELGLRLRTG